MNPKAPSSLNTIQLSLYLFFSLSCSFLAGDFNELTNNYEKWGGNTINSNCTSKYIACMNVCNMMDLGFVGPKFTWSNLREPTRLIHERIDKGWANPMWRTLYPEATIFHLPRTHSDHCPLLVDTN